VSPTNTCRPGDSPGIGSGQPRRSPYNPQPNAAMDTIGKEPASSMPLPDATPPKRCDVVDATQPSQPLTTPWLQQGDVLWPTLVPAFASH